MKKESIWKTLYRNITFYIRKGYFPYNFPYKQDCPSCHKTINFMRYSGMSMSFPHFYCNKCSNVIHRQSDFDKVMRNEPSLELLQEITATLPKCSCGGNFQADANPKCPYCKNIFCNNTNPVEHLTDPFLILIEGSKLYK